MSIELDHFFILTDACAPQADLVANLGLTEGPTNKHLGQGTANRRFFLQNTCLEFLYVHDEREALMGPAKGLRFLNRSTDIAASPFGLVMRSGQTSPENPFDGWQYCPDYFASNQCFHVGSNSTILEEPLCIVMPQNLPQRKAQPTPENKQWTLTELRIGVPVVKLSHPLEQIAACRNITVQFNHPHSLELTFNEGAQGMRKEFEPAMPLIFNW